MHIGAFYLLTVVLSLAAHQCTKAGAATTVSDHHLVRSFSTPLISCSFPRGDGDDHGVVVDFLDGAEKKTRMEEEGWLAVAEFVESQVELMFNKVGLDIEDDSSLNQGNLKFHVDVGRSENVRESNALMARDCVILGLYIDDIGADVEGEAVLSVRDPRGELYPFNDHVEYAIKRDSVFVMPGFLLHTFTGNPSVRQFCYRGDMEKVGQWHREMLHNTNV